MNAPINTSTLAANAPVFNERGLLDATIPPEAEIQAGMMQRPPGFAPSACKARLRAWVPLDAVAT